VIEVRLGSARARLWENGELPRLTGEPAANRQLAAAPPALSEITSLAVEVAIPRGGVVSYGLLGATFVPDATGSLSISVLSGDGQPFTRALAGPPEEVMIGLANEYVDSVINGILAGTMAIPAIPGGSLVTDRAAHGAIGSSALLFRELAACVTRLVLDGSEPWQDALRQELHLP